MLNQLQKPEYIHVLLNHLPITGLLVSATALLIALILRSRQGQICALAVIALCSAAAWPVYLTGKADTEMSAGSLMIKGWTGSMNIWIVPTL